eukprot:CAMPEP_0197538782 /NCGR_PEP_ID=MMETSP1318-20131121/60626_1 /TAXON_ID=552666 /ORGANISM="Partenskyella glossopodia, Strain RCC365" /LENGTH=170 /DNA_ID=CAMNT_0043097291 /DNA_START=68 /DNA_END=580 /DNA_ORIENTATION=+
MANSTIFSLALNIVLAVCVLMALMGNRSDPSLSSALVSPGATSMSTSFTQTAPLAGLGSRTAVNFHRKFKFQSKKKPNPPRKWPMKCGDKVKVIAGDDKGKESEIKRVFRKTGYVIVKDVNVKTKHQRPFEEGETGSILQVERPIHHSNLKVIESGVYKKPEKVEAPAAA